MSLTFDRNLFTQVGLDSGSLTMLGAVIHSFQEPGEYRGVVRQVDAIKAVFYVSADKNSAAAQVNIDLALLTKPATESSKTKCCSDHKGDEHRFSVNPRGYAVFHVSGGAGGYDVHIEKAIEGKDTDQRLFDSRTLSNGDLFSAVIIRPGTYSVKNLQSKARAEVVVSYPPQPGKTAYRPPAPLRVECAKDYFEPKRAELKPGQGLIFECKSPSRIKIELVRADDGPKTKREPVTRGWKKRVLPKEETKKQA